MKINGITEGMIRNESTITRKGQMGGVAGQEPGIQTAASAAAAARVKGPQSKRWAGHLVSRQAIDLEISPQCGGGGV